MSNPQASHADVDIAIELLKEITAETASDQIGENDLTVEGQVGEGIHSCVRLGILRRGNNVSNVRQVAVKEFRHQHAVPPVSVLRAFRQEYRILARCRSQNGHQHVVELLGVTLEPRLIILMEYFDRGSLAQCLQDEAAWGEMSIKQHDMIHRDIKSHNILISGDLTTPSPTVKIGDLGSAVVHQQHDSLLQEEVGSSGYTAPEIFTRHGYDSKVDVWSFGIVLWELASSCLKDRINPFMGMAGEEFVTKVQDGCRPKLAHPHQIWFGSIVEKCWRFDPSQRPCMNEVIKQLEKISDEL
ncbi:hypothetical protein PF011_g28630 [Phytophthora fragariae]|uniref:Protein kinase domain-containing protein n=1 Tax=Phytophthora fragariae TaxID=53985 RepID=A0A6A3H5X1_9STRA|nr:hypothetical protein PF011_g28630 [Phytophthora fragariae]KAE9275633.1 hypothetical protein PF008_g29307 [Phytophthora fragariae]